MKALGATDLYSKIKAIQGQKGYVALYINLSRLQNINRQPHYIRIAATTFDNLVFKNATAAVYVLKNMDVVFVGQSLDKRDIQSCVHKIRYLFSEDPLVRQDSRLWLQVDISSNYESFYEIVHKLALEEGGGKIDISRVRGREDVSVRRTLNTRLLGAIESSIQKSDLSSFVKSRPICAIIKGAIPQIIYYEKEVHVSAMIDALIPGGGTDSNPWFLYYIDHLAHERALSVLKEQRVTESETTFCLKLSTQTILSQVFLEFDHFIGEHPRDSILIQIDAVEVIACLEDYKAALSLIKQKGYQTCFSGVTAETLGYFNACNVEADLLRITWNKEYVQNNLPVFNQNLKQAVERFGPSGIILADCDDKESVKLGHEMGVYMFHGRFIDGLILTMLQRNNLRDKLLVSKEKQ